MNIEQRVFEYLDRLPKLIAAELPAILGMRAQREGKADGSYVTRGDLRMQELVISLAQDLLPEANIVSEELKHSDTGPGTGAAMIVIDPIDGTENFTSGLPEWGVSVACYAQGQHIGSLLGCPEMDLWHRTGRTLERHWSRIRGISSSLTKSDLQQVMQGSEYRVLGCCVYNMINVIRGSFHSFENPKGANSWDILAGLNLALEQDLAVTVDGVSYAGEYLPPTRKYRFKVENR